LFIHEVFHAQVSLNNSVTRRFMLQQLFKESSLHFPHAMPSLRPNRHFWQYEYTASPCISRFWLKIICINLCLEIFEEISLHRLQNFDQNFIFFCKATIKKLTRYEGHTGYIHVFWNTVHQSLRIFCVI